MRRRSFLAGAGACMVAAGPMRGLAAPAAPVVIAGGDLTEIAFALGAGDRVVGVDSTSTWPAEVAGLPQVGYLRRLSAEGILSLAPDLLLAGSDAGPDAVLGQIRAAGVEIAVAPETETAEEIPAKIDFVGKALGQEAAAAEAAAKFSADLAAVKDKVARLASRPRVLFVLSFEGGGPVVAGEATKAAAMIALSGGENAARGFEGYKPMSREAILAAAPDVILMMAQHATRFGGTAEILARPEIALTPAARAGRVVTMDGPLLLGFGIRTPEAVAELARALHPDTAPGVGL